ncbi:hypothetical protein HPP92_013011 [Vanilla planifolia]|uniref:Phosphatidic acid phosphatase type 2/haloperoxidase domain-containing protein n=1 Tax=Vanilla planifolia TaxID=51239 RepID=A0A835R151_VANPL|nr:hypothetical protein HPP92_013478 [Vanilla planifolia]KAG0478292.1 hypothetical protein HPP92_013011 [Vanilla planifolia]
MLPLPLLSFAPIVSSKSKRVILTSRFPRSKIAILISRSASKGRFVRKLRVFKQQNVLELSRIDPSERGDLVIKCDGEEAEAAFRRKGWWGSKGFEPTLNRLSKWFVAALFGIVLIWKHDEEAMWAAMGSVVNAWLSKTLKKFLNQDRPSALRSDPGMPSSHAQSIFYVSVFVTLSLTYSFGVNAFTVGVDVITLILGSYLSSLRVSQQLHTVNQVIVGAAVGSASSIAWFWMWHLLVQQAFNSSIWVRILVFFSSVSFCLGFLIYVVGNWLEDE